MDILKSIKDKTIIICNNDYKMNILKMMSINHLFLNVKFYTKKDFLNNYLFNYDERALYYLVYKYNLKVQIARMYLDNLIYLQNDSYNSSKLQFLYGIKKELEDNGLLIYNNLFKKSISDYNIIVIGYSYLEPFELEIFNNLNFKYIKDESKYEIKEIYEFNTMEEEIDFVCKSICKLINKGISINKIKIVGIEKDYYNDLERISKFYNLEIKIPSNNTLYSHTITKKFLENVKGNLKEGIVAIQNENEEIVNKIINICNKYMFDGDIKTILKLIINDLKKIEIDNYEYQNYIEIKNIDSLFTDEYVFFMNFNNGSNPISIKDEEYITDNIKEEVGLNKTYIINKLNKEYLINKLKSIKNLIISYKLADNNGLCYPSSIIKELGLNVTNIKNDIYNSYSYLYDKIKLTKELDDYNLYGEVSEELKVYHNSFDDIGYKSFDNRFKGINKNSFKEYLNNHLTLSYSSLSNYNKCAFRYYITNILKLDKYEESFEAFIGSLFHDVLEKCFSNNLIVEEEINKYIQKLGKELTIKERFFVNKVIEDIKFVINILNRQKKYIDLDHAYYEKNIKIDKSKEIKIEFTGYIDKILYKEDNNESLIAIIDYKTGYVDVDLKYLPYGLNLQLPIYLYLVKKSNMFKNPKIVGFYLQYILNKDISRDLNISYEEQKKNNLKLMGYSTTEERLLKQFDNSYQNSDLIKGMKLNATGNFSNYAKVLNNKDIEKIVELTENNIDDSINKIINCEFPINPKRIGYDNPIGCLYCHLEDICFRKEQDFNNLEEVTNLDFLGGDDYAKMD